MGDRRVRYVLEGLFAVSLIGVPAYLIFGEHGLSRLQSAEVLGAQLLLSVIFAKLLSRGRRK